MTWLTRLRIFGGIRAVLVLAFGLPLLFNQRMTQAHSLSATVTAPTFDVGSGYGGIVNEQFAANGDQVSAGDVLLVVSSSSLQQAVSQGAAPGSTVAYDLKDPALPSLTRDGTPITAQVRLRDDGILTGPTASALAFLMKIGLR